MIISRLIRMLLHPLFFGISFLVIAVWLAVNPGAFVAEGSSSAKNADRLFREWRKMDAVADAVASRIENKRDQRAFQIAMLSTQSDERRRSVISRMAEECAATGDFPFRVRLASIALDHRLDRSPEQAEAFLVAHAFTCESLALSGNVSSVQDYLNLLSDASKQPAVWDLVSDDPVALNIWSETGNMDHLSFYRKSRDWLADPLVDYLSGLEYGSYDMDLILGKLFRYEESLKKAITEGKLDMVAIQTILSHGALVDTCRIDYHMDPSEVIAVVFLNQDILNASEGDRKWIDEHALWLHSIATRQATVWFSAMNGQYALRLYRDAPDLADDLCSRYGADNISVLIYGTFPDDDIKARAAAKAIHLYGDMAIAVFARYDSEENRKAIGDHLIDSRVGMRTIPFIMQFRDRAFDRLEENIKWADRYFDADGTMRDQGWIEHSPGGALYKVAENFVKGYPSEWSEMGWAAFDFVDVGLTIASFGTSQSVTGPAKAAASSAKILSSSTKVGARAAKASKWSKSLEALRSGVSKNLDHIPRIGKLRSAYSSVRGLSVAAGEKFARAGQEILAVGENALGKWKSLSPKHRLYIKRGVLGVTLLISIKARTIPNRDVIAKGVGTMLGEAAAGAINLAGTALANAIRELADDFAPAPMEHVFRWLIPLLIGIPGLVLIGRYCARSVRQL